MDATTIILRSHINPKGTNERVTLPAGLLSVGWECFTLCHYDIYRVQTSSNNEHILWPTKILQHSFLLRFILKNNQLNALKLLFTKHIKTNKYITTV